MNLLQAAARHRHTASRQQSLARRLHPEHKDLAFRAAQRELQLAERLEANWLASVLTAAAADCLERGDWASAVPMQEMAAGFQSAAEDLS
jgi:hypothetical protein